MNVNLFKNKFKLKSIENVLHEETIENLEINKKSDR